MEENAGRRTRTPISPTTIPFRSDDDRNVVVDDNDDAADMLTLILRTRGHHVESVHDGELALAAQKDFCPGVVCLDIGLPGMDGYEVCRRLRSMRGPNVLVIALTGYGSDMDRTRAHDAGFDFHLVKPIEVDKLDGLIQAWANGANQIVDRSPAPPPKP